ncbi:TPA: hypothetical protein QCW93_004194 [Bacillus toyonensis]|nr:hypothetical protein [Bacillus toyonensis]HDR7343813.1 hypothetical protein [Bacillus toyonensis]HDR7504657.1 hypothetical protein [Bacillus toyonensis]
MGFLLPKAKPISGIADVQDCGVLSPNQEKSYMYQSVYLSSKIIIVNNK